MSSLNLDELDKIYSVFKHLEFLLDGNSLMKSFLFTKLYCCICRKEFKTPFDIKSDCNPDYYHPKNNMIPGKNEKNQCGHENCFRKHLKHENINTCCHRSNQKGRTY